MITCSRLALHCLSFVCLLSACGGPNQAAAPRVSNETGELVDYDRGERCPDQDRSVWPWWQGEYPVPVIQINEPVTLPAYTDICQPVSSFRCTVPPGLYHPWSEIEAEYRTVRTPDRYTALVEFEIWVPSGRERTTFAPGTVIEVPYYIAEGYCVWRFPDASEAQIEETCPEGWDDDDGQPVFERLEPAADAPGTQQFFSVICEEGRLGWIEATQELFTVEGIIEGGMSGWGEVEPR
jgi:hypothetical protein